MRKFTIFILAAVLATASGFAGNLKTQILSISPEMECSNCENRVTSCIADVKGVKSVTADRKSQTVSVTYDSDVTSTEAICAALTAINVAATPKNNRSDDTKEPRKKR